MIEDRKNKLLGEQILPVDIVLAPEWWYKHEGISFDRDFFFHPVRRLEDEQMMEKVLYERWGQFGLGAQKEQKRPEVGAVHLAAGFMLSEMIGCKVDYLEDRPPQVIPANKENLELNVDDAFKSQTFKDFERMTEKLKEKSGYLTGDVNWGGILNLALDVRSQSIFLDMAMEPDKTREYFSKISEVIDKFTSAIAIETGSSSVSVNRNVRNLNKPMFLHSECSNTMISCEHYEEFLIAFDIEWSKKKRPFGIHYCGDDPHRYAASFAKIPHLDFLDVGWGGDVKKLREHLPNTFLNIRLSPVEIVNQSTDEIRETITRLVRESANPYLTGVCCINMDEQVTDDKITTIFETVGQLKEEYN
jgi:hypothetical protein